MLIKDFEEASDSIYDKDTQDRALPGFILSDNGQFMPETEHFILKHIFVWLFKWQIFRFLLLMARNWFAWVRK